MKAQRAIVTALGILTALAACGPRDSAGPQANPFGPESGVSLNGVALNKLDFAEATLDGQPLEGLVLAGVHRRSVRLGKASLADLSLQAGELIIERAIAQATSSDDLRGAELVGDLSDGRRLTIRLDDMQRQAVLGEEDRGYTAYVVSFLADQGWRSLCGQDEHGVPLRAIALEGTWDYREGVAGGGAWNPDSERFTFACKGGALAKCVEMGYPPWEQVQGISLNEYHQACTRMVRADYCGDGRSWTVDGRAINPVDTLGIQQDVRQWALEAEWTPEGAVCLQESRLHNTFPNGEVPPCLEQLSQTECSSVDLGKTALIISEVPLSDTGQY